MPPGSKHQPFKQGGLTLEYQNQKPLQGLLRMLRLFIQDAWGDTQEVTFLTISQAMPMLLVQEPHFENHCSNSLLPSRFPTGRRLTPQPWDTRWLWGLLPTS